MQDYASSSSAASRPLRIQDIINPHDSNVQFQQIPEDQEQSASFKGKEPMRPRIFKRYKKNSSDSIPGWTFVDATNIEPNKPSGSKANDGPIKNNTPSNNVIKHTNEQGPSTEKFIMLIQKINPDVPLSAITKLNLSKQDITRFDQMKSHLTSLKKLILSDNKLTNIENMPTNLNCLNLARNRIATIDLKELKSLHRLDLSNNSIEDFSSVTELRCLRNLDASHNKIRSVKVFKNMNHLLWLSLQGNGIERIQFDKHNSYCMRYLNISNNKIKYLEGIENLHYLDELVLGDNSIISIALERPMKKLSKLLLDNNQITVFDATLFPRLIHLSLDNNAITSIVGLKKLELLDFFSIRNQNTEKTEMNIQHLRQSKQLCLSKCNFGQLNSFVDFYSLKYLELCSIGIDKLPQRMAHAVPNLSVLNLNYNSLRDLYPIRNLKYLEDLSIVGNKILNLPNLIDALSYLKQLKHLDLRKNPVTAVYYSSKFSEIDVFDTKSPSQLIQDVNWGEHDIEYLSTLDPSWRERRMIYRALVVNSCPCMMVLDRIPVKPGESGQSHLIISDYASFFETK